MRESKIISNLEEGNLNEKVIKALKEFKEAMNKIDYTMFINFRNLFDQFTSMERKVEKVNSFLKGELNGFMAKMLISLENEKKAVCEIIQAQKNDAATSTKKVE